MHQLTTVQALQICLLISQFTFFLIVIYAIFQPARHAKIKGRRASKEEIDLLFDTVDPFNPASIQEFCNN